MVEHWSSNPGVGSSIRSGGRKTYWDSSPYFCFTLLQYCRVMSILSGLLYVRYLPRETIILNHFNYTDTDHMHPSYKGIRSSFQNQLFVVKNIKN